MLHLLAAEVLKMRTAPFVRGLLFFFLAIPLVLVVLFGIFLDEGDPLRFPQNLGTTAEMCTVLGVLLPGILLSWSIGQEQTNDTWKLLLARHPRRFDFYVAKAVVVFAAVVVYFAVVLVVAVVVQDVVGRVVGQESGSGGVAAEQGSVDLLGGLLMGLVASSSAVLATALAPKNGSMAGIITAITLVLVQGMLEGGGQRTALFQRPCFYFAAQLLGAESKEDGRLDPQFAALTLLVWLLVPLVVAAVAVARRDVESGNG